MKTIKLHYDSATGEILGYYPSDLTYVEVPTPYITISNNQYALVLHNESKYRVQNKALEDISETVDYRLAETSKLLSEAATKIESKAADALAWGVIIVNETYYVNVHWKSYYASLQSILDKEKQDLSIKIYALSNSKYYLDYKSFNSEDAAVFLEQAITAIDEYCTQYVPEKQNEYTTKLKSLKKSKNSSGITNFINSIDYGYTLDESLIHIPLKV